MYALKSRGVVVAVGIARSYRITMATVCLISFLFTEWSLEDKSGTCSVFSSETN